MPKGIDECRRAVKSRNTIYRRRIAARLAWLAVANGITQKKLAFALGKTTAVIRKYELGTQDVPAYLIPILADLFEVKLEAFFFDESPKVENIPNFLGQKERIYGKHEKFKP